METYRRIRILSFAMAVALCLSLCNMFACMPVAAAQDPTKNQKNMVARADWYYGITWVAQETTDGWSGTFYKGGTYHIPYGQPIYSGKYVGYAATFDEFLKAASTAGSIFYTGRSWYEGTTAPYYVSDCSAFVSWVWGIDRTTTYYIPGVTTSFGYVTTNSATYTLQLGDALNCSAHVVMVTGLEYDANGAITRIEITEQTPPQMKRSSYTPYQLYQKYSKYTIQRYYGDVPTAPGTVEETWVEKAAFDVMVYRDRNPDLAHMTDAQLKEHWKKSGIKEGRASSVVLDLGFYLNNNPDLKNAFGTDYEALYNHFITKGYKEKRKSSAAFDGAYYVKKYPEVANSFRDDYLRHYMENGMAEGRRASLTYDPDYYWFIRPDVKETWPGDYEMAARHYAGHGVNAQTVAYDNQQPVISNVVISDISSEGYTITCTVKDNWKIKRVAFPTWTVAGDQDDLPDDFMNTQQGTANGSTYSFRVKASEHNYETGEYITHIYAEDQGGNQTQLVLDVVNVQTTLDKIRPVADGQYVIADGCLTGIEIGTTVDALLSGLENEVLEMLDPGGNPISGTALVSTGSKVNLYVSGKLVDSLEVSVRGDVDGNGLADATDYLRIKAAFLERYSLCTSEFFAADVDENSRVDSTDYLRIKEWFLGDTNAPPILGTQYWGYFYDFPRFFIMAIVPTMIIPKPKHPNSPETKS